MSKFWLIIKCALFGMVGYDYHKRFILWPEQQRQYNRLIEQRRILNG